MTAEARSDCRSWFKAGLFNIQHKQSMIRDLSQQACKPVQLQTLKLRGRFAYLMLASCLHHCCRHAAIISMCFTMRMSFFHSLHDFHCHSDSQCCFYRWCPIQLNMGKRAGAVPAAAPEQVSGTFPSFSGWFF